MSTAPAARLTLQQREGLSSSAVNCLEFRRAVLSDPRRPGAEAENHAADCAACGEGILRVGFKDTFGIFAGERVRVLMAPPVAGLFMYHCHNLEHEDGGMMRNCVFTAP